MRRTGKEMALRSDNGTPLHKGKEQTSKTHNSTDKPQGHYAEHEKVTTKEYRLYNSIYVKFQNRK